MLAACILSPRNWSASGLVSFDEDLTVSAYRFEGDRLCTSARFEAYQEALGSALEPGEPMFEALQDMIEFLRLRLA